MTNLPLPDVPQHIKDAATCPDNEVSDFAPLWYYVTLSGEVSGPISLVDMLQLFVSEALNNLTPIYFVGWQKWQILQDTPVVKEYIKKSVDDVVEAKDQMDLSTMNKPKKGKQIRKGNKRKNTSVYITGLPRGPEVKVDEIEKALKDIVSRAGQIAINLEMTPLVKLYKDEKGELKGDALVTYVKEESVAMAIKYCENQEIGGSKITIEPAKFTGTGTAKSNKVEDSKRRRMVQDELKRRTADVDEISYNMDQKAKPGAVIGGLWTEEIADDFASVHELFKLYGSLLEYVLSRSSSVTGMLWGGWRDLKRIAPVYGSLYGKVVVYTSSIESAQALVDAINNSELPWGPVNTSVPLQEPLPTLGNQNTKINVTNALKEHNLVTAHLYEPNMDLKGTENNPDKADGDTAFGRFLQACSDNLLPKRSLVEPELHEVSEKGLDILIAFQRRLYTYIYSDDCLPYYMVGDTGLSSSLDTLDILESLNEQVSETERTQKEQNEIQRSATSVTYAAPSKKPTNKPTKRIEPIMALSKNNIRRHPPEQPKPAKVIPSCMTFDGEDEDEVEEERMKQFMDEVEDGSSDEELKVVKE